jgi:hypothetical protein
MGSLAKFIREKLDMYDLFNAFLLPKIGTFIGNVAIMYPLNFKIL